MKHHSENDPVWDILENASNQEADAMFSRDVMRTIRIDASQDTVSWWERLLRPAPVIGSLATAAACVALIVTTQTPSNPASDTLAQGANSNNIEASFDEIAASYESSDEFDDLISPIPLVAHTSTASISDLALFMEL